MNSIDVFPDFARQLKRLAKKHPSLVEDIRMLAETLSHNAHYGTNLGEGLFKIRLSSSSKNKGKSGGFRVITYLATPISNANGEITGYQIYLVLIYDKAEVSDIPKNRIMDILKEYLG